MTPGFRHGFPFDPTYGYDLAGLLSVEAPAEPPGFAAFWRQRYARALDVIPHPELKPSNFARPGWQVSDLRYRSTDDIVIGGWLLVPEGVHPRRGLVLGHGYGCAEQPDFELPCDDAVYLVPCFRGLGRSRRPFLSDNPLRHVLHGIEQRERYIIGGCVADLWIGVSALLQLYPQLEGRIGYLGISFGGGIGALALPWDDRIDRGHLNVPTFGHQPLRLRLPTTGSAAAVQAYARRHGGHLAETLAYYDAAVAARYIQKPVHVAAALFDPVVTPPGQFAVYNTLQGPKTLFVLAAGHFDYPDRAAQECQLLTALREYFGCDEPRVLSMVQPPPGA